MWLFLIGLVLGTVIAGPLLIFLILRRGALRLSRPFGSTWVTSGSVPLHKVNDGELLKIIEGLLPGQPYDYLGISRTESDYGGVSLGTWKGELELSVSFNTHSERDSIQSFRQAMASAGFEGTEDSASFNGGFTEECRSTRFEYVLQEEAGKIFEAVKSALDNLFPLEKDSFYVRADCFAEKRKKGGVSYDPYADYLELIVGRPGSQARRRSRGRHT